MYNDNEHSRKEHWKDDILSSIEGIQRSEAPPFLFARITARLRAAEASTTVSRNVRVPAPILAFGAIAFVLLCFVNVWVLADFTIASTPNTETAPLQAVSTLETFSFDMY
jgi:hypothetical protein